MKKKEITLQEVFAANIAELRENGRWGTSHIYEATLNAFSDFCQNEPFPMKKLTPGTLKKFENHLRQRNCSWNTVSTYLRTLRTNYYKALDRNQVRYIPRLFQHVYTGTKIDRKKALENSEISTLVHSTEDRITQPDNGQKCPSGRNRAELFFVLMFMLRGIPFVDLVYLHKTDINGDVLTYRRKKTGRELTVTLTPEALRLIRLLSSKNPDSPYLFPILRSPEGTEEAYHEYQSALRCFNQCLNTLGNKRGISSRLSSYSARHTWATLAYHCEVHPGIISEAMGHSSIRVTETYLKPFETSKIDAANATVISFVKDLFYE